MSSDFTYPGDERWSVHVTIIREVYGEDGEWETDYSGSPRMHANLLVPRETILSAVDESVARTATLDRLYSLGVEALSKITGICREDIHNKYKDLLIQWPRDYPIPFRR
jgi:hypothetical protein